MDSIHKLKQLPLIDSLVIEKSSNISNKFDFIKTSTKTYEMYLHHQFLQYIPFNVSPGMVA
jgi:hypothetical protein